MKDTRLRASPNFIFSLAMDGSAFVAQECEPYAQYWLSETERRLYALFAAPSGQRPEEAFDAYFRLQGEAPSVATLKKLAADVAGMRDCGVLLAADEDTSRYTCEIVDAYLRHRPFPTELTDHIVRRGAIGRGRRVLDLAGGPGDLALQMAASGAQVSLMELSEGFLRAAQTRAVQAGLDLTLVHDSCNRLLHHGEVYDVITIAQALHWMDDVQLCRGLCRTLAPDGSFFVVHAALTLRPGHPLSYLLGDDSILGAKSRQPFDTEVQALGKRLNRLFEAFELTPDAESGLAIQAADISLFRQPRPINLGFARAFLTDRHIDATGLSLAAFWADVESCLADATREDLVGVIDWAVVHFQRGPATDWRPTPTPGSTVEIGFATTAAAQQPAISRPREAAGAD